MASGKALGARLENQLANLLWGMGFAVVRGPSSGSGARRRFQPDLVAIRSGKILVFEVKRGHEGRPLYLRASQVEKLAEFASRAGGEAFIAVHIPWLGWRIHRLDSLERVSDARFKISNPESGLRLEVLVEMLFPKSRRLDEFM